MFSLLWLWTFWVIAYTSLLKPAFVEDVYSSKAFVRTVVPWVSLAWSTLYGTGFSFSAPTLCKLPSSPLRLGVCLRISRIVWCDPHALICFLRCPIALDNRESHRWIVKKFTGRRISRCLCKPRPGLTRWSVTTGGNKSGPENPKCTHAMPFTYAVPVHPSLAAGWKPSYNGKFPLLHNGPRAHRAM